MPRVLGTRRPRVGHVKNVIAEDGQGTAGASGERHVDAYVEGVPRRRLVALQLPQQRLVICSQTKAFQQTSASQER